MVNTRSIFHSTVKNLTRKAQLIHTQCHAAAAFAAVSPDGNLVSFGIPDGFGHVMLMIGYEPINMDQLSRYQHSLTGILQTLNNRPSEDLIYLQARLAVVSDAATAKLEARD